MATWRFTSATGSAAPNATWRTTGIHAEGTAGPNWRLTRVAAESDNSNGVWRTTAIGAEINTALVVPTADAGTAAQSAVGELVRLDGSGSFATGTTIATYTWRFISGSIGSGTPTLSSTSVVNPSFRIPVTTSPEQYTFGLRVTDANGLQSTEDTVTVSSLGADLAWATGTTWVPAGVLWADPATNTWI